MPPNHADDGLLAAHKIRAAVPSTAVLVLSQFLEGRRVPMVGPLKKILREEWVRRGQPARGAIVVRSIDSRTWEARADKAWTEARLARVTLHEARHTYASFLMAAPGAALIAEGRSNRFIATEFVVTVSAVERHITSMFAKLGLRSNPADHRRVLAALRYLGG